MKQKLLPLFEKYSQQIPSVSGREIGLFDQYFDLLQEWNEKMALVSKTKILDSFAIHFVDSLFLCEALKPYFIGPMFDVGSGAGFPGLVYAIRNPKKEITLFEKAAKKRLFLEEVVKVLGLSNVAIRDIVPQEKISGSFFARAVRPPDELVKWLRTILKWKSILLVNYGGETPVLRDPPGFRVLEEKKYLLPQDQGSRKVQVLEKT